MKTLLFTALAAAFLLTSCVVSHERGEYRRDYDSGGPGVVIAPILPPVVVLEDEPYYYQNGYHYHYQNNVWYYSTDRKGPWKSLPKDRYPKEVRGKHREGDRDRDHDHDRDHENDRDHH